MGEISSFYPPKRRLAGWYALPAPGSRAHALLREAQPDGQWAARLLCGLSDHAQPHYATDSRPKCQACVRRLRWIRRSCGRIAGLPDDSPLLAPRGSRA